MLTGCSAPLKPQATSQKDTPPEVGSCYALTPKDTAQPSNASAPVACTKPHTSQTFAIGTLPDTTGKAYRSPGHGKWIFPRCERAFERFIGVDESLALRVQLSWSWFRPSEAGWKNGDRWYRCDVVGRHRPDSRSTPRCRPPRRACSGPSRPSSGSPAPRDRAC